MANQLGKRYICGQCNAEVLCTKAGDGSVYCCDQEMQIKAPQPLASAD